MLFFLFGDYKMVVFFVLSIFFLIKNRHEIKFTSFFVIYLIIYKIFVLIINKKIYKHYKLFNQKHSIKKENIIHTSIYLPKK